MKKLIIVAAISAVLFGCKSSPTGRTQIAMYSDAQMSQLGSQSFDQLKQTMKVNKDAATNRYVNCVAEKVIATLPANFAKQTWEVVVFEEQSANAFALPGGKIGVHTGLLNVATNQHQLAAVLGHEVGHVIGQHSNERLTAAGIKDVGMQVADVLSRSAENTYHAETMGLLGLATEYGGMLPFSRLHESEADEIGLDLMAKAGFNPEQSVSLWENMSKAGGATPPEFLSTHPSPLTRIKDLNSNMAAAKQTQQAALQTVAPPNCKL
jgi:predicted Zn-dependent protease